MSWLEPDNHGPPITQYNLRYQAQNTDETWPDNWTVQNHMPTVFDTTISGLQRGVKHRVEIAAVNEEGTSEWSEHATHDTVANSAPVFTDGDATIRALEENSTQGTNVGEPLAATDANTDPISFAIPGANTGDFSIEATTGQIQAGNHDYDHEKAMEYTLTVQATDPHGATDRITVTVSITDVNEPPGKPDAPNITEATTTTFTVSWLKPDNHGPPITQYNLRYQTQNTDGTWPEAWDNQPTVRTYPAPPLPVWNEASPTGCRSQR